MYRSFAEENDNWTYRWTRYISGCMLDCNWMCYGCIVLDVCWFIFKKMDAEVDVYPFSGLRVGRMENIGATELDWMYSWIGH